MGRVIISGGGTGGHIYPAITIARAIADIEPTEFLYVGSKIGLENTLIPKEGLPFVTIDVRGLERRISFRNVVTLGKTAGSVFKAERIIHRGWTRINLRSSSPAAAAGRAVSTRP